MIEQRHIDRCRGLATVRVRTAANATFWAGAVLVDEAEQPSEHDVAQLAQDAFPQVDALEIARAALPVSEAIARIHESRRKYAAAQADKPEPAQPVVRHNNLTPPCPECQEPVDLAHLGPKVLPEVCFNCPHCHGEIRLHHEGDQLVLFRTPVFAR